MGFCPREIRKCEALARTAVKRASVEICQTFLCNLFAE
jgi:hypothetical protein